LKDEQRKGYIAVTLAHLNLYKRILNENYSHCLIFEDDSILNENFISNINKCILELPNDYDVLYVGDGCQLHISSEKLLNNVLIYESKYSRCSDSYLISQQYVKKFVDFVNNEHKIDIAIDHFMNTLFREKICKVFWAEPTFVIQGTQNNTYCSSLMT
jgi:GR25 family glycosyltransferase involved in LPS biosynthesis